ncbi:MAG: hypothetical protein ACTSWK_00235 [Promethearchaeota archaeon]
MKFKHCKKGMHVKISEDITKSIEQLGNSFSKRKLAGSIQRIDSVRLYPRCISIAGWNYVPEDLHQLDEKLFFTISEIKKGMIVRLDYNLKASICKFGGGKKKERLGGTRQIVSLINYKRMSVTIYDINNHSWNFLISDLRKYEPPRPLLISPEIFDPSQLFID